MIRTQISLEESTYREAKVEARRRGISLAELLRRSLSVTLHERDKAPGRWMRYAGTVASGDPRASRSVNEVVYGRPRP
jgi:hypothetical protein